MNPILKRLILSVIPISFIVIAFFAKVYVLSDHTPAATFYQEIQHPGYEPSPAYYVVTPSPAKAWELTHLSPGGRTMDAIAVILFWAAMAFLVLNALDFIPLKPTQAAIVAFVILAAWMGFKYGAHSSAVTNTQVIVTPADFEKAKATPGGLDALFNGKKPL